MFKKFWAIFGDSSIPLWYRITVGPVLFILSLMFGGNDK